MKTHPSSPSQLVIKKYDALPHPLDPPDDPTIDHAPSVQAFYAELVKRMQAHLPAVEVSATSDLSPVLRSYRLVSYPTDAGELAGTLDLPPTVRATFEREVAALFHDPVRWVVRKHSAKAELGTFMFRSDCVSCHKPHAVKVTLRGLCAWWEGTPIQDALPSLSAADREFMISLLCPTCFDAIFEEAAR